MSDPTPDLASTRARVGAAARWGGPEDIHNAKRQLKALNLERAIKRAMRESPRINKAQRARLAALLQDGVR